MRPGPRPRPPACEHTRPAPYSAATSASCGSQPPQVSFTRSAPASHTARADLVPPGVHADHQVGVGRANRGDERDDAADLLVDGDLGAGLGGHAADVEDVRALGDHLVHPVDRGLLVPGQPGPVEGVRRAVDDRHDEPAAGRELRLPQPQRSRLARPRVLLAHPCTPHCRCRLNPTGTAADGLGRCYQARCGGARRGAEHRRKLSRVRKGPVRVTEVIERTEMLQPGLPMRSVRCSACQYPTWTAARACRCSGTGSTCSTGPPKPTSVPTGTRCAARCPRRRDPGAAGCGRRPGTRPGAAAHRLPRDKTDQRAVGDGEAGAVRTSDLCHDWSSDHPGRPAGGRRGARHRLPGGDHGAGTFALPLKQSSPRNPSVTRRRSRRWTVNGRSRSPPRCCSASRR